jgi:hypothetical protein
LRQTSLSRRLEPTEVSVAPAYGANVHSKLGRFVSAKSVFGRWRRMRVVYEKRASKMNVAKPPR